jgi:LAO/AO transport system kinase
MDVRALARTLTEIENGAPVSLDTAGHGLVIGITGPPGAGKSTLIDALTREARTRGKTVAIVAVDPSSRITGGAILGDRIRMQHHHADPGVFIRSLATRGASGGIARTTGAAARYLRSQGFDYVFIETVGVGQDEIEIANLVDATVLVLMPGAGDDIQAIKAGVMEIASIYVINKSDQPGADRTEQDLKAEVREARIVRTVATKGTGIPDLLDALVPHPVRSSHRACGAVSDATPEAAVNSIKDALRILESALGIEPGTLAVEYPAPGEVPIQIVRRSN